MASLSTPLYTPTPFPTRRPSRVLTPALDGRTTGRLQAISRLSSELGQVESESMLRGSVLSLLAQLFEGARAADFYLLGPEGVLVGSPRTADLLLAVAPGDRGPSVPNLVPARPAEGRGSRIMAPVFYEGAFYGVLAVEASPGGPALTLHDLETLCMVAAQVALLLTRVRPAESPADLLRVRRDLALAGKIQRRFLPPIPEQVGGIRIAADYRPAFDVGGDFYGVVPIGHDILNVVIGDVCGHGVAAALMMARVSYDFHRLAKGPSLPSEILTELAHAISEHCPDDAFVTAMCLRFDLRDGRVTVANAGHLPPLVRRADGQVLIAEAPSGLPLGMFSGEVYEDGAFSLEEGDMVTLFTDGVVDSIGADATAPGLSQLARVLTDAPADVREINRAILAAVEGSGSPHHDDVAVVTLEILERQPPSQIRPVGAAA